jgi:hypothetical protein
MTQRKLSIILFIILFISIFIVSLITLNAKPSIWNEVRLEIVKYLLQLAVVIVIGGIIAALFKTFERSLEESQRREEESRRQAQLRSQTHEDYLRRLGILYRTVKASRRILRSCGLATKYQIPESINDSQLKIYAEEMRKINASQLELEGMMLESERLPVFVDIGNLSGNLHTMEEYLRDIFTEFEEWGPILESLEADKRDFLKLSRLDEFTGTTNRNVSGKRFLRDFWSSYNEILDKISTSISTTTSNKGLQRNGGLRDRS